MSDASGLGSSPVLDPRKLERLLLYGQPATRRSVAENLARAADQQTVRVLAETVRAPGPWLLRARCLEALGVIACSAEQNRAEFVLDTLLATERRDRTESSGEALVLTGGAHAMTRRERHIAALIAQGLSNAEVAEQLGISRRTVENHVSRTLGKLGLTSRTQLAVYLSTDSQPAG